MSILFFSCEKKFQQTKTGLEYKFIEENKKGVLARPGDILTLKMVYKTNADSILFNSKNISDTFRFILKKPGYAGSIEEGLAMMHIGDSAHFKINARSFYDFALKKEFPPVIPLKSQLTFEVRLDAISKLKDYEKELGNARKEKYSSEYEIIKNYINENKLEGRMLDEGLFFIETKKGKGKQSNFDDVVEIKYTGRFLDARVFDSNENKKNPFRFKVGSREVIEGFNIALQQMKEGSKVTVIVPSLLAYGEKGTNRIPPFTPLLFDIELVKVLK
jgi:FKBP-type peptidyl-prolyl cis-trans isomerase